MISSQLLERYIKQRFPEVKEVTTHFLVPCPFCGRRGTTPGTKFKLYISKEQTGVGYRQGIRCFKCNYIGPITALFPSLTIPNSKDLWRPLQAIPKDIIVEPIPEDAVTCESLSATHPIKEYLLRRGISESNFLFCYNYERSDSHKRKLSFGPRILIPIIQDGVYRGFQARAFNDHQQPKYLNSLGFLKSNFLYGWDNVMEETDLVIVEGVFDVYGFYFGQAVAAFGKELSHSQRKLIWSRKFKRIIVLLDKDAAEDAKKAARQLAIYRSNVYYGILPWKDPGSSTQWENMNFISHGLSPWRSIGLQKV